MAVAKAVPLALTATPCLTAAGAEARLGCDGPGRDASACTMSTNYDFTPQTSWGACLLGRCAERKLSGKLQEATAPEQKKSLAIEDVWTFACSPIAGTNVCKRPAREKQGYSVARSPSRACCSAAGSERVGRVDMTDRGGP